MYSTCLFCNNPLGTNEVLEMFPVGRRIAFDSERGRLWVVCRSCERWNLSPLDERWEALDECERLFSDARLRTSTENIGLAKLSEGLELVRVGAPLRPEFAAWRYGDQFGRRRRRAMMRTGIGLALVGGAYAGLGLSGFGFGGLITYAGTLTRNVIQGNPNAKVATIDVDSVNVVKIRRAQLSQIRIVRRD